MKGLSRSSVLRFSVLALLILVCVGGASAETSTLPNTQDSSTTSFSGSDGNYNGMKISPEYDIFLESINVFDVYEDTNYDFKVIECSTDNVIASGTPGNDKVVFNDPTLYSNESYAIVSEQQAYHNTNLGIYNSIEWVDRLYQTGGYNCQGELNTDSGAYDFWQISFRSANEPPQFNSTSINPEPPLIGENVSYGAEVYDSDGSVDYTNLSLSYGGSTVVSDEQRTGTVTPEWNDVYTPQDGNKWLNATLEVVDDKGAVTTTEINRFLDDNPPSITLNDPQSQDYFKYDVPLDVEASDSDSRPDEVYSCTVDKNTSQSTVASFDLYENGTNTYSDTVRSDLGSHNLSVTCSDGAGNSDSVYQAYDVKAFELSSFSAGNNVFESVQEQFSSTQEVGGMVENVTYNLVYDGGQASSISESYSSNGEFTESQMHSIPLVDSDGVSKNWRINADVAYSNVGQGSSTETFTGVLQSQTVDQAYKLSDQYLQDGSPQLEASDLLYNAVVSEGTGDARGSINGTVSFEQTGETVDLKSEEVDEGFRFFNTLESELVGSSSETHGFDLDLTYSFDGESRPISSSSFDVVLDRMELDSSSGEEAFRFDSYAENGTELNSDFEANFEVFNPESPGLTRSYSFDSDDSQSHSIYMSPSYGVFRTDVYGDNYIEYDAAGSQAEFYDARNYYLLDEQVNNETSVVDLYLLQKSEANSVQISVENPSFEALENHVVRIERSFQGGSESRTVAMIQTGSSGTDSTYLNPDEQYVFTVYNQDGEKIEKIGPQSIPSDLNVRLEATEETVRTYDNLIEGIEFETQVVDDGVVVNYDTGNTESVNRLELKVSKDTMFEGLEVGSDNSTSTSGQLTVEGLNASENRYRYQLNSYFDGTELDSDTEVMIDSGTWGEQTGSYGDTGLFVSLMIFLVLTFAGMWRAEAAIGLGAMSLIVASFVGFLPIGQTALISAVAVAAVLIWRMS